MDRVRVQTVYLVPICIVVVMCVNRSNLWSRAMITVGLEELALTTLHDKERVKGGKQKLFAIQKR